VSLHRSIIVFAAAFLAGNLQAATLAGLWEFNDAANLAKATVGTDLVIGGIIDETMHIRWGQRWVPELIKHQSEPKDLDTIIAECRQAVLENSLAPPSAPARRKPRLSHETARRP
jgi:hypothetical protein